MIWSTLEFPSFNFNSILDRFCILKRMLYMMPLSRHALSLQTGLHRRFILGTVIPPTPASSIQTTITQHFELEKIDFPSPLSVQALDFSSKRSYITFKRTTVG